MTTSDDYRDAIGWLYATARRDWEARAELAEICNPLGLVEALADIVIDFATVATDGQPTQWIDYMRNNLDDLLEIQEGPA